MVVNMKCIFARGFVAQIRPYVGPVHMGFQLLRPSSLESNSCDLTAHPHLLVWATNQQFLPALVTSSWLSLVELELKVAPAGRSCSLLAHTSKCGWAIGH